MQSGRGALHWHCLLGDRYLTTRRQRSTLHCKKKIRKNNSYFLTMHAAAGAASAAADAEVCRGELVVLQKKIVVPLRSRLQLDGDVVAAAAATA